MSIERNSSSSKQSSSRQTNQSKLSDQSHSENHRPFSAGHMMNLQNSVGNQAVQQLLSAQMKKADAPIQRMGIEEEELQMKKADAPIQRMGIEEEELQMKKADAPIQRMGIEEEELQMKKADAPIQKKSGAPADKMPDQVRTKMESTIGADFSSVKIHEGSQASSVGALAYTQGNDIHFAPGQYDPESTSGQQLLGHELTHVKQQREGRVQPTMQAKGMNINDDAGLEKEADIMGAKAAAAK